MKNSFKLIAVFAFVFAVGVSFAAKGVESASVTGHYFDGTQVQSITVDCQTPETSKFCTYNGHQVYAEPTLQTKLYKVVPQ